MRERRTNVEFNLRINTAPPKLRSHTAHLRNLIPLVTDPGIINRIEKIGTE